MRYRHPERGTEVEVDDDAGDALAADGYKAVGSSDDSSSGQKSSSGRSRKKDD